MAATRSAADDVRAKIRRAKSDASARSSCSRTPFAGPLAVAGVFAVFIIALFGFIYWQIDDYLDRAIRPHDRDANRTTLVSCRRPTPAGCDRGPSDGRIPAAFNLPGCSAPDGPQDRAATWQRLPPGLEIDAPVQTCEDRRLDQPDPAADQVVRAIARRHAEWRRAGDRAQRRRSRGRFPTSSARRSRLGLVPAFCLCLLAGAWLSVRAQKRVEEVNQRVQRIIAGDLRERLPLPQRGRAVLEACGRSSTACSMRWKR